MNRMLINSKEMSEPETRAYIKQLETACKQAEDENKELKWLLKKAVSGFKYLGAEWMEHEDRCTLDCSICPLHNGYNCSHWNLQDEALKLIGGK